VVGAMVGLNSAIRL